MYQNSFQFSNKCLNRLPPKTCQRYCLKLCKICSMPREKLVTKSQSLNNTYVIFFGEDVRELSPSTLNSINRVVWSVEIQPCSQIPHQKCRINCRNPMRHRAIIWYSPMARKSSRYFLCKTNAGRECKGRKQEFYLLDVFPVLKHSIR